MLPNGLRIGNGLAESGIFFRQLINFENFPAIEAFHVFGVVVFRDDLRAPVFAGEFGRFGHGAVLSTSRSDGILASDIESGFGRTADMR